MSNDFPRPASRRPSRGDGQGRTPERGQERTQGREQNRAQDRTRDRTRPEGPKPGRPPKSRHEREEKPSFRASGADEERFDSQPPDTGAREEEEASLLPGVKPVLELLENNPERVDCVFLRKGRHSREMEQILELCRENGIRFSLLETDKYARIYSGKSQGVVARLFATGFADLDELLDSVMDAPLPLIVFLDQVQDPGNAGTLARTLYAMGGAGMVVPRHNGVYLGAAAFKASAGALQYLPVAKAGNLGQALDAASKRGFTIYGAVGTQSDTQSPEKEEILDVFSTTPRLPAILVLGGEEDGMRPGIRKRCDKLLGIPMLRAFDSLNVAQAGAIIIGCFSRHAPVKK